MKVLGGVVEPTAKVRHPRSPAGIYASRQRHRSPKPSAPGIAFVHQELNLFDNLDVAANVFIGREPVRGYGPLQLDRPQGAATPR